LFQPNTFGVWRKQEKRFRSSERKNLLSSQFIRRIDLNFDCENPILFVRGEVIILLLRTIFKIKEAVRIFFFFFSKREEKRGKAKRA